MKEKGFLILLIVLAVGLFVSPVSAKTGGVKVSTASVSCGDTNKETNSIQDGTGAKIWLNNVKDATPFYIVRCKDGHFRGCTTVTEVGCGSSDPNYEYFNFTTLNTTGDKVRCTLTVYTDSACKNVIGRDSWLSYE